MKSSYTKNHQFWERTEPSLQSDLLCRPQAVKLLGNVQNKIVLDAGCGSGYVSEKISKLGAMVVGVDTSKELIAGAIARNTNRNITYHVDTVTKLSTIANASIDHYLSILVFDALKTQTQIRQSLDQAHRVLKRNGIAVIAMAHPLESLVHYRSKWLKFNNPVQDYFSEHKVNKTLFKSDKSSFVVENLHLSLSDLMNTIISSGFTIQELQEPRAHQSKPHENFIDEYTKPAYILIKLKKSQ